MNAYATIEKAPNTTINGRVVRAAIVALTAYNGDWLGAFTVFGRDSAEIKERAYAQADLNLESKGYSLQYIKEAA